eukprot:scaffold80668_cov15-Tisochrysis_lutea.AAC.1
MPVMVSVLQAAVPMWAAWVTAVALVPLCVLDFAWGAASALVQALALVLPAQSPDLVMVPVRALVLGRAPVWALLHAEVPVHALLPVIVMVQEA